ncbi:hypothetical protein EBZ37_06275 [bacterium]|nr:hypothetical protein [bacterium]
MFSVAPILSPESADFMAKLEKLRSITGVLKNLPPMRESLFWEQASTSVPRGALTEISGPLGSGKTEAVLKFLAEHQSILGRIAWIEDRFTGYPSGFLQHGVELSRLLFIEGGTESLWATHQVLRSQIFGAVILFVRESTLSASEPRVELRRLQLSAEQSHTCVFLLTHQARPQGASWPLALQLQANPETRRLEILKQKKTSPVPALQAV